jgi:cyclophilin family peptidyl-prolyl cis-trans isomerase
MMMKHMALCRTILLLAALSLLNDAVVSGFSAKMIESSSSSSSSLPNTNNNWNRRQAIQSTVASCFLLGISNPSPSLAAYLDPNTDLPTITKRVYLDVQIGKDDGLVHPKARIVIGLFGDVLPRTVDNFVSLCEQNAYAGTTFYRVLSGYCVQGGAIGDASGRTGKSSLPDGKSFEPDNYNIRHTKAGLVSMVRGMDGSVDSRFFIQGSDSGGGVFDDRYAAFGIVLQEDGMDFVRRIEKVDVQPPKNVPKVDVRILASGVLS